MIKVLLILLLIFTGCAKDSSPDSTLLGSPSGGSQGPAGIQGATGGTGSIGLTGATGYTGQSGSQITPVPFCPSIPGPFPETGLLINNILYAVYYDSNGAHLAATPPGEYRTTDGRNCIFIVNSDNSISYP